MELWGDVSEVFRKGKEAGAVEEVKPGEGLELDDGLVDAQIAQRISSTHHEHSFYRKETLAA